MVDIAELARLVIQARGGDREAFGKAFDMTEKWVRMRLHECGLQDADVDDVALRVYVAFWGSLHSIKDPISTLKWLGCVSTRLATECRARIRARPATDMRFRADEIAAPRKPESDVTADEILARVPEPDRTILRMSVLEGRSVNEIAVSAGRSPHHVAQALWRAKDRVARWYRGRE